MSEFSDTGSAVLSLAAEHGLKPGDDVIVLTIRRGLLGHNRRELYRYDTEASLATEWLREGSYVRTREPWDGRESVSFDNGD